MTLTVIALDKPSESFGAMFTSNAFPGAPVIIGRKRLASEKIQAVVINNKISNVCAPGGVEDSEAVCTEVAKLLALPSADYVIPSSTGVIGWKLPLSEMIAHMPSAIATLQPASALPAATGIMTTDMYPKVRSATVPLEGGAVGRVVGIAKGAGMVEPNLATMLVYLMTDIAIPRDALRAILPRCVDPTFNALSIDSDMSTSDTVVALSSGALPLPKDAAQASAALSAFEAALRDVCASLSEDIVRNGEGVQHVMRVKVAGAPTKALARAVGKSIVNSPLFKCAVAGNDPNVGRLVAAIGKCVGQHPDTPRASSSSASTGGGGAASSASSSSTGAPVDVSKSTTIRMGGIEIYGEGKFRLTPDTEKALVAHMKAAQLWESLPALADGAKPVAPTPGAKAAHYRGEDVTYHSPVNFPAHERMVEIDVDLGIGSEAITILGSDLTHEYVSVNADYRS